MLTLRRTMTLGIVVFLTVWTALSSIGQVVGSAPAPTLVSPANNAWVTENTPTFKWRAPSDNQSGFSLQISTEINFVTPVQNIPVKSSTQNYTLTTALNDGMYYWRVKTNDTNGDWSSWSFVWIVGIDTTPPDPVTVRPVRLHVKLGELRVGELVELNWTASEDPYFKRYEIYVSTDPDALGTNKANITRVSSTKYALEVGPRGLDSGTTYYLSVVVVNQAGLKSDPRTVEVTTAAPLDWSLIGGVAVAVELAVAAIVFALSRFIKKE